MKKKKREREEKEGEREKEREQERGSEEEEVEFFFLKKENGDDEDSPHLPSPSPPIASPFATSLSRRLVSLRLPSPPLHDNADRSLVARGPRPPRRPLGRPRCREAAAPGPPGSPVSLFPVFSICLFLDFRQAIAPRQLRRRNRGARSRERVSRRVKGGRRGFDRIGSSARAGGGALPID